MCLTFRWDASEDISKTGAEFRDTGTLHQVDYENIVPVYPVTIWPEGHVATTVGPEVSSRATAGEYIKAKESWWDWSLPESFEAGAHEKYENMEIADADVTYHGCAANIDRVDCDPTADASSSIAFYAYGYPMQWSANSGRERQNTVALYTVLDEALHWTLLYIVDKAWDGSGGSLWTNATGTGAIIWNDWGPRYNIKPLDVILEDDAWAPNHYDWNGLTGRGQFYWNWLECCTDGMIMGYLPQVDGPFSLTFDWQPPGYMSMGRYAGTTFVTDAHVNNTAHYFWNKMDNDQHPNDPNHLSDNKHVLGGKHTYDGGNHNTYHGISDEASAASIYEVWNTYPMAGYRYSNTDFRNGVVTNHDVLPHMAVLQKYKGVQIRNSPCSIYCSRHTNCGRCSGDMLCSWSLTQNSCQPNPSADGVDSLNDQAFIPNAVYPFDDSGSNANLVGFGLTCPTCAAQLNECDCLHLAESDGCGWAPFEKKCISGHPDYPSDHTVTIVQWDPLPCTCYKAAYNEKRAFAEYKLMNEFGIDPITHWTTDHPKVVDAVCGGGAADTFKETPSAGDPIMPFSFWSASGNMDADDADCELVPSAVAFYAYDYPFNYSANPGSLSSTMYGYNLVKVYLVKDTDMVTYLLMVVDRPYGRDVGTLTMSLQSTGDAAVMFGDDPGDQGFDSSYGKSGSLNLPDTFVYENVSSVGGRNNSWLFNWNWGGLDSDGVVFGPMVEQEDFTIDFQVHQEATSGVSGVSIGSYNEEKNAVNFMYDMPLKSATEAWGGVSIQGMGCTDYCQSMYENCEECVRDERCQFARMNGGCVSAHAYVPTNGCPAPPDPPERMLANTGPNDDAADSRTSLNLKIRRPDKLNWNCPCVYTYYVVAYLFDNPLKEVGYVKDVEVRQYDRFSYATISGLEPGTSYHVYTYICSQDECGTYPLIDTFRTDDAAVSPGR